MRRPSTQVVARPSIVPPAPAPPKQAPIEKTVYDLFSDEEAEMNADPHANDFSGDEVDADRSAGGDLTNVASKSPVLAPCVVLI